MKKYLVTIVVFIFLLPYNKKTTVFAIGFEKRDDFIS